MIRDRLFLAGLACCASLLAGLLVPPRRRGFRGTYEQPIEPRPAQALDLEIEEYLWAEPSRRIG